MDYEIKYQNIHSEILLEQAEERGISHWGFCVEISEATGVDYNKIYSWIWLRKKPKLDNDVFKVVSYLGMTLEFFAFGIGLGPGEVEYLQDKHEGKIKKERNACKAEGIVKRIERHKYIQKEKEGQMHFSFSQSYTDEPIVNEDEKEAS